MATAEEIAKARRAPRVPLSALFAGLFLLILMLMSVVAGMLFWREQEAVLVRGEERARNVAQTAAEHARWLIEANLHALSRADALLGDDEEAGRVTADTGTGLAGLALAGTIISVIDTEGMVVLTSEGNSPDIDVSDRDYFVALVAGQPFFISRLVTGRVSGRKVFVVSRRIERQGAFAGAFYVEIPVEILIPFWLGLDLGPSSSVGLINEDGWQVARYPIPQDTMDFSNHELFREHLPRTSSGSYRSPASPVDGIARIVGFHAVPDLPLVAVVGIAQDTFLADLRRNMLVLLGFGMPLLIALGGVSVWGLALLRREERTRAELVEALEQNTTLMREIHHRVKNNLQVVTSLINLQPGAQEAKAELSRRIAAMAATYEHIYRGDQFTQVYLDEHLPLVIDALKEGYVTSASVDYDLDRLLVPIDRVLPLTLIASEVAANAFKHAFPQEQKGRITVALRREGSGTGILTISDDGVGLAGRKRDGKQGIGMKLLAAFSRQLDAEYSYDAEAGTTFVLRFPL